MAIEFVTKEWATIKAAPIAFVGFFVAGFLLAVFFFETFVIPEKDAQIADLGLRQPVLATNTDNDDWPALTDDQIKRWTNNLQPYHLKTILLYSAGEIGARRLEHSFKTVAERLDCHLDRGVGSPDNDCDIEISASDQLGPKIVALCEELGGVTKLDPPSKDSTQLSIFLGEKNSASNLPTKH